MTATTKTNWSAGPEHDRGKIQVRVRGSLETETPKAYLFVTRKGEYWLPKSQCEWDAGTERMTMPMWLLRKMRKALDRTQESMIRNVPDNSARCDDA